MRKKVKKTYSPELVAGVTIGLLYFFLVLKPAIDEQFIKVLSEARDKRNDT